MAEKAPDRVDTPMGPPPDQASEPVLTKHSARKVANAQPDSLSVLKSVFESGDSGDIGAACLGFSGGMIVDVLSHGTSVLAIGSAAVAGATAAVGVKRSISAWFGWSQSRKPPEGSGANRRRLEKRADALATILSMKSQQILNDLDEDRNERPFIKARGEVDTLKRELDENREYFETGFLQPHQFEDKLEDIFQRMQNIRVTASEVK